MKLMFKIPDFLKPPDLSLKHLCRETIRKPLMKWIHMRICLEGFHSWGFYSLTEYLLYNVSLDDDDDDDF